MVRVVGIDHLVIRVSDYEASKAFYGRLFGFLGFDPTKIITVVTGPMYHSAPNAYGMASGRLGGTVILQARFDPEALLQLIDQYRVTHLHMVPIMFNRLLKLPDAVKAKYDLSSLQFVVHAAAPCPCRARPVFSRLESPSIKRGPS